MYCKYNKTLINLLTLLILLCIFTVNGFASKKEILLKVENNQTEQFRSILAEKIARNLSKLRDVKVVNHRDAKTGTLKFPEAYYDIDSLLEWGREIGGRFLFHVRVERETVQVRKTFSIPLIVHKYQSEVVMEGEVQFLDLQRGKVLYSDSFSEHIRVKQVFQGDPEHNKHDPDLHIPASQKSKLFTELETKVSNKLSDKVKRFARAR